MEIQIKNDYKSIKSGKSFFLPSFCVLTGKNGSGKTHLLEAMANNNLTKIVDSDKQLTLIKYIRFGYLTPAVSNVCDFDTILKQVKDIWKIIKDLQDNYKQQKLQGTIDQNNEMSKWFFSKIDQHWKKPIKMIVEKSGIPIENLTEDIIRKYLDFNNTYQDELFQSEFATIFKAYHTRQEENKYSLYLNDKFNESNPYLSEKEFIITYGPPPWELINELLSFTKLPYRVNNPVGQKKESSFKLILSDPSSGLEILVDDLSTGEKVLMSLVLAIYNSTDAGIKLDLLLLDEPDAGLHPEFSKLFIDSLNNYIVKKANVNVVLTTHSPTTVASCNGIEIFEMNKEKRIPIKSTIDSAVNILAEGLTGLRVSTELRRQVFVESLYDVNYYEKFYDLINNIVKFDFVPQFLPPHSRNGCNCDDVKKIVSSLTGMGNDLVFGIIDYDDKNKEENKILILGDGSRYSIENYIFDPVFVGLFLLRNNIMTLQDFGITSLKRYIDCKNLSQGEMEKISDKIVELLGFDNDKKVLNKTIGGKEFYISESYLKFDGHKLESKIKDKWYKINDIIRGKTEDNVLKEHFLDFVVSDFSELISLDFIELFKKIK